jgi:CMP-N,N'-diacetyllegionaminic acid synthase
MRVLAVVPARGGSKGLPGKNIRPLAGIPLIGHSLRAAALVPSVDRCVVSTDDRHIALVARDLGGDVPFLRPAELAEDETPMAPVLRHALTTIEAEEGAAYDLVVLLDPTSPARDPEEVQRAVDLISERPDWDGVVAVSAPTFHPVWVGVRPADDGSGRMERYFPDGAGVTRRQQLPRYLRVNGSFYVWRSEFVRRMETSWMDEGVHGMVETPEGRAFAIDYQEEFDRLEALIAQGVIVLPWLRRGGEPRPR